MKVHYTTDKQNLKDEGLFTGVLQNDGYHFGGRILEGVIFLIDVEDGVIDPNSIRVHTEDAAYFSSFNEKKWLKAAKKAFLEEEDEYGVYPTIQDVYVAWPEFEEGDPQFIITNSCSMDVTRGEELFDSIEIETNSLYETERNILKEIEGGGEIEKQVFKYPDTIRLTSGGPGYIRHDLVASINKASAKDVDYTPKVVDFVE